jgi:hypothetical protein
MFMSNNSEMRVAPEIELDNNFMVLYKLEDQEARKVVAIINREPYCELGANEPLDYPKELEGTMVVYANDQYFPVRKMTNSITSANDFMAANPNTSLMTTVSLGVTGSKPEHLITDNTALID